MGLVWIETMLYSSLPWKVAYLQMLKIDLLSKNVIAL